MKHKLISMVACVAALLATGCVIQPVQTPPGASIDGTGVAAVIEPGEDAAFSGYALKPLDPLFIRFSGIMEQQSLELVIDENGEINLLHLPTIMAAGLTASALEDKIEQLYITGGIYKNVSVNVTMTAKVFYVQGEVNQPGQFQLTSGTTLLQAIAGARGYTAFANRKKVTVTRQGKIYSFNVKELEKDPSKDVKIEAGDVIKVWQQWY